MDFTSFAALVKDEVEKRVGGAVVLRDVQKNNGIALRGLTILQDGCTISPVIYLNHYYDAYKEGAATFDTIIDDVVGVYEHSIDMRFFLNYETVKSRIVYKLINTDRNKELLDDVPHIPFNDLSIVFQCLVSEGENGISTILIHHSHMKLWKVTTDDLMEQARLNTPRILGCKVMAMSEVMAEMVGGNPDDFEDEVPMYVVTNRTRMYGASCILYPDLLKKYAELLYSDLCILPSSIHECIIVPTTDKEDAERLQSMVREINASQVEPEEVLSDSVYCYCRETDSIQCLAREVVA